MGVYYRQARQAAFRLAADASLRVGYRILGFPEQLSAAVLPVCNLDRVGKEPLRTAPTYRLNGLLQVLASEVTVLPRSSMSPDRTAHGWIYHPLDRADPLPDEVRRRLLSVWLEDLRPEPEYRGDVRKALDLLEQTSQGWIPGSVALLESKVSPGGTAAPASEQYTLVTDHFARRIQEASRSNPYSFEGGELIFSAVAQGGRQEGAELVSQPIEYKGDSGPAWFSILITLRLHTVPFDPQPRLHIHLGRRRWATALDERTGQLALPYGADTSVYLRPSTAWLPGAPVSRRFGIARITWDRDTRRHRWHQGDPAALLRRLALTRSFPEVDDLLGDPAHWLDGSPDVDALVVHSTRMGEHPVGKGLMSHQRSEIMAWLETMLGDEIERVPDLHRSSLRHGRPQNARDKTAGNVAEARKKATRERRISLARRCRRRDAAGRPVFEGLLVWIEPRLRDLAVQGLTRVLGLANSDVEALGVDDPATPTWETAELVVRLRCRQLGPGLGDDLGVDARSKRRRKDHADAVVQRRAAMRAFLSEGRAAEAEPSLAIVAIPPAKVWRNDPLNDPKFALRLGAVDAGILTQFIANESKSKGDRERAEAIWLDGFRQLGASVTPILQISGGLPAGTRYLALWMASCRRDTVRRPARKFPIAVLIRPENDGTESVLGWDPTANDSTGGWTSYASLLTRLPKLAAIDPQDLGAVPGEDWEPWPEHMRKLDRQRRDIERFIQKILYSTEVADHPTILLAHAQNCRQLWTWLQDGNVRMGMIRTGQAPAARIRPSLRLVRVRTADQGETPQWWGISSASHPNGLPPALWTRGGSDSARIFYSTTEKPAQFKHSAVGADVLASRPIRRGERKGELTTDVEQQGWNPGLVEIAVLSCHPDQGDSAEAIAMAVHQQRQVPGYGAAIRLPLPLHLAKLAQEYVLPVRSPDDAPTDAEEGGSRCTDVLHTAGSSNGSASA